MVVPRDDRIKIMNPLYALDTIWERSEIIEATKIAELLLRQKRWRQAFDAFDVYLATLCVTEPCLTILLVPEGSDRFFINTQNIVQAMYFECESPEVLIYAPDAQVRPDEEAIASKAYSDIHDFIERELHDPEVEKDIEDLGSLTLKEKAFFGLIAGTGFLAKKGNRRIWTIASSALAIALMLGYRSRKASRRDSAKKEYTDFVQTYVPKLDSLASNLRMGKIRVSWHRSDLYRLFSQDIRTLQEIGYSGELASSHTLPRDSQAVPTTGEMRGVLSMMLENVGEHFLATDVRRYYMRQLWNCISTYPLYRRYEPFLRWIERHGPALDN